jgi:hypothetical protein
MYLDIWYSKIDVKKVKVSYNLERRVSITGETYAALSRNKSSVLIYISITVETYADSRSDPRLVILHYFILNNTLFWLF